MEKKREPQYLDLSAKCEISVTELLQRLLRPQSEKPAEAAPKEAHDDTAD